MNKRTTFGKWFAGSIVLLAWFALVLQLILMINTAAVNHLTKIEATWRFFGYFTILTNVLVALNLSSIIISPSSGIANFFSKPSTAAATATYICIVGLIYNILLRPLWNPEGWQKIADELLHVLVPLLYILYWYFFASKKNLKWKNILQWLIYPLIYFCYALTRGAFEGFYPYPFINVKELGYGKTFLNAGAMMIVFIIIGGIFIAIGRKTIRKNSTTSSIYPNS